MHVPNRLAKRIAKPHRERGSLDSPAHRRDLENCMVAPVLLRSRGALARQNEAWVRRIYNARHTYGRPVWKDGVVIRHPLMAQFWRRAAELATIRGQKGDEEAAELAADLHGHPVRSDRAAHLTLVLSVVLAYAEWVEPAGWIVRGGSDRVSVATIAREARNMPLRTCELMLSILRGTGFLDWTEHDREQNDDGTWKTNSPSRRRFSWRRWFEFFCAPAYVREFLARAKEKLAKRAARQEATKVRKRKGVDVRAIRTVNTILRGQGKAQVQAPAASPSLPNWRELDKQIRADVTAEIEAGRLEPSQYNAEIARRKRAAEPDPPPAGGSRGR